MFAKTRVWLLALAMLFMVHISIAADTSALSGKQKIEAILPQFEKYVNEAMKETHVPGVAVGIVYGDQVVYVKGFGVRDIETQEPVDVDTRFLIGSVSKMITASALAKLVSDGKAGWDDKVIHYLPGFKLYDPWVTKEMTIRDLLTHRSGLPTHTGDILAQLGYNRAQILERLRFVKPTTSFRSRWDYQNSMYAAAGDVAAAITGKDWADSVNELIYQPLGMSASSSRMNDFLQVKNRISMHVIKDGKAEKIPLAFDDTFAPSGGVNTTVSDMTKWLAMELNKGSYQGKQLIAENAVAEMQTPQIVMPKNAVYPHKNMFYGFGVVVEYDEQGNLYIQHAGALDGIRSYLSFIPAKKIGIVILANAFPNALPEAISHAFFDLYFTGNISKNWVDEDTKEFMALLKSLEPAKETIPPKDLKIKPSLPFSAYTGTYHNDYLGDLVITESNGELHLKLLTPRPMEFMLEKWSGDKFAVEIEGAVTMVVFTVKDKQVTQVKIDGFTNDVEAVFTPKR